MYEDPTGYRNSSGATLTTNVNLLKLGDAE